MKERNLSSLRNRAELTSPKLPQRIMLMQDSVSSKQRIISAKMSAKMSATGRVAAACMLMGQSTLHTKFRYCYINPSSPLLLMKDFLVSTNLPTNS
jgi:hypothetical protein